MVLLDADHADSSWLLKFKNFIIKEKHGLDFQDCWSSVFFAACLQSATGIDMSNR